MIGDQSRRADKVGVYKVQGGLPAVAVDIVNEADWRVMRIDVAPADRQAWRLVVGFRLAKDCIGRLPGMAGQLSDHSVIQIKKMLAARGAMADDTVPIGVVVVLGNYCIAFVHLL